MVAKWESRHIDKIRWPTEGMRGERENAVKEMQRLFFFNADLKSHRQRGH